MAIRVNPDVDAKTHAKISTGKSENKFGVPYLAARALYAEASTPAGDRGLRHSYAHRQPDADLDPFRDAFRLMRDLTLELQDAPVLDIHHLDIGGGLGVPYRGSNDVPPHLG